jgi:hypothetical protein
MTRRPHTACFHARDPPSAGSTFTATVLAEGTMILRTGPEHSLPGRSLVNRRVFRGTVPNPGHGRAAEGIDTSSSLIDSAML